MTDDEVLSQLRTTRGRLSPADLARLLAQLRGEGPSHAAVVTYFKRAFPEIPLRALLEAGGWSMLSGGCGDMSEADFNAVLEPWIAQTR